VQVLLVASAGSMARTLPVLAIAYYGILFAWTRSVDKLSQLHVCAFTTEEEDGAGPESLVAVRPKSPPSI
jgi:hypothetical protein